MAAEIASELEEVVESAGRRLQDTSPEVIDRTRPAGAWSSRQILGHLIDSAANNHHRFVRIQQVDMLEFPAYDQRAWVASQHYEDRDWADLLQLWVAYNRHLVHVLCSMPDEHLAKPCLVVSGDDSAPLALHEVALSYIAHMRHHLAQLGVETRA